MEVAGAEVSSPQLSAGCMFWYPHLSILFSLPFSFSCNVQPLGGCQQEPTFPSMWLVFWSLSTWFYGTEWSCLCKSILRWVGMSTERLTWPSPCCRESQKPSSTSAWAQPCYEEQIPFQEGLHNTKDKILKSSIINLTQHVVSLCLGSWKNLHFQSCWLGILV